MSRSERFTEPQEIRKKFRSIGNSPYADKNVLRTGGPVIYYENGTKYYDDSESHILVNGNTGCGKSGCVSSAYAINCLEAKENLICIDPKGDLYYRTCYLAERSHRVICIDFRNPRVSKDRWNPLLSPFEFYTSEDPTNKDIASNQLRATASSLYPRDSNADPFWCDSAIESFLGFTYGLFEKGSREQININSVARMMEVSEQRTGMSFAAKEFSNSFPEDSIVRRHLAAYVSAPTETRASIHAVAANSMAVFSHSRGLMELLSHDTIGINSLDVDEKPLAIYIIIPDESSSFDSLAGLLVSQLMQHFIRLAHDKYNGRLPSRINLILEELSSVGKSISDLDKLMSAGRSRNIRIMMVLQNGSSQLVDVYGKSKASSINSCVGITFAFSTNSWETLEEYSKRCGERIVEVNGTPAREPLITATQLAAMPVGTPLVIIGNRYKYVTKLPFYSEMFDMSDWKQPISRRSEGDSHIDTFNMIEYLESHKEASIFGTTGRPDTTELSESISERLRRISSLTDDDDDTENDSTSGVAVRVITDCGKTQEVAAVIADAQDISVDAAEKLLGQENAQFRLPNLIEAERVRQLISAAGGIAVVIKE